MQPSVRWVLLSHVSKSLSAIYRTLTVFIAAVGATLGSDNQGAAYVPLNDDSSIDAAMIAERMSLPDMPEEMPTIVSSA